MKSVLLTFLSVAGIASAGDVRVVERIVAKVNNEIITQGDLDQTRKQMELELKQQQDMTAQRKQEILKEAETNLLRDRIDNLLLVQKGKDLDIKVDSDVSKRLAEIQLRSGITDPDKFQAWLREQTGMPFEDFRQQLKDQYMRQEVIRHEVMGRIAIPETEFKKYYDEHQKEFIRQEQVVLREIFLSTEGKNAQAVAAIEKKAKDLVARARKGENFGNMARDNSDGATAQNYGELAPFQRGVLKKDLEDIVFKQQKGYVTDPIRQSNGFEILKVEEHYQEGLQPYEMVKEEVMNRVYGPRMEPEIRKYLTKLRQDAFLQIREGYVDTGAAPGKDTAWKDPAKLTPQTTTKQEVAMHSRRKRMLWMVPVPGTNTKVKSKSN